jgi:3D (Asp-Asp-Asp) domain-containing protein
MDKIKLLSCGFLLITGWGTTTRVRPATPHPPVAFATFFKLPPASHERLLAAVKAPVALPPTYTVTATAYEAVAGQTDADPFVTADNSRIPKSYSSHTRWLALSRDLLSPWGGPFSYGDTVQVRGISPALDGMYTVHDTMNRRHHRCLDVLVHPREHVDLFKAGAKIQLASL